MKDQLLHVFRNSPMGRENLMQSAYFCDKQFGLSLAVLIPTTTQFRMEFESGPVTVDLDASYTAYPTTARQHVQEVLKQSKGRYDVYEPKQFVDPSLPIVPVDWAVLSCPRVISDQSSRIGLGHIGPKVRGIVKHAPFPVFIPSTAFKPWTSVSVFFGGSQLGAVAVKQGIALARLARVPFTIYTQLGDLTREQCEDALAAAKILNDARAKDGQWHFFSEGPFEENLYAVPHDSLVIVGAAGHRLMAELIFGSKLETIQATLLNPLVVVGPNCRTPWEA